MPSSLEIGAIPRGDLAEARTKGILHCFKKWHQFYQMRI